ncbi:putative transcription factor Dp-1 [Paratrimastix pyriformis]|uniref:Transcription factor Dp-1 n=1 Tax=Paratrimastix pyriformis TaxID=342808 RepID=A0ABQ8ULR6_9EUKA|nr:putative transcription factor Dp-1 [Paratrimastix pyriformis]
MRPLAEWYISRTTTFGCLAKDRLVPPPRDRRRTPPFCSLSAIDSNYRYNRGTDSHLSARREGGKISAIVRAREMQENPNFDVEELSTADPSMVPFDMFDQTQMMDPQMMMAQQRLAPAERKKRKTSSLQDSNKDRSLCMLSKVILQKIQHSESNLSMNELANQVVHECAPDGKDSKNIRRRVYDCVNVLHSAGVIQKGRGKREIIYVGTDGYAQRVHIQQERTALKKSIDDKKRKLALVRLQKRSFELLIDRNRDPAFDAHATSKLLIPFIIINTHPSTTIDCEMSDDRTEVTFDFSRPFEIHDDNEILRKIPRPSRWPPWGCPACP